MSAQVLSTRISHRESDISLWTRRIGQLMLHVTLLGIGFIYIYPFLWMVGSSLKTQRQFFTEGARLLPANGELHFENFVRAWDRANFSVYFFNSVFISVLTVFFVLLLTSLAGYAMARLYFPGLRWILIGIAVTYFLPRGYSILPTFEIVKALGLLNTRWAIILVETAGQMIFGTFFFFGYFRTVPIEIEEAAILDGAGDFQRYRYVMLPLAKPMLATLGLFTFMGTWNSFFIPLVFSLGNPDIRTMAVGMYAFVGERTQDWTGTVAAATMTIAPVVLLYMFLQRYFIEAFASAVKN